MTRDNIQMFLDELTKLSKKYNMEMWSCGCCGSPFLKDINSEERDGRYIGDIYCTEEGEFFCDTIQWKKTKE